MEQWKEELINAKEEIIYVKHERGDGATTTILNKILNSDKDLNVLYYGFTSFRLHHLDLIEEMEILSDKIKMIGNSKKGINKFILKNGSKVNIYYTWDDKSICNQYRGIDFDMGVLDGIHLTIPKLFMDECKQKIIILREKELDSNTNSSRLIDSQRGKEEKSFDKLIQEEIVRLATELSITPNINNTALYRKNLVEMIEKLHNLHKEVR